MTSLQARQLRYTQQTCIIQRRADACEVLTSGVGPPPAAADSAGSPVPRSFASSFGCVFSSRWYDASAACATGTWSELEVEPG